MPFSISRTYSSESFGGKPTLDEKILIFEDRVLVWHLGIAELLDNHMRAKEQEGTDWNHAGFSLMNLLFTYFEMIAQYRSGTSSGGASKKMFCDGIEDVFPGQFSKETKEDIYSRIRCGMYHNAFVKKSVLINGDYPKSIAAEDDGKGHTLIKVNPHRLSPELNAHFRSYISDLNVKAGTALRNNFTTLFDS